MSLPVLWSFRRCPYAMRARLAIAASGVQVELREVVLRDKPFAFIGTSPSATVPCLDTGIEVIDESLDIMFWALDQSDPEGWLNMPEAGHTLILRCDDAFKSALDHYKYPTRYEGADPLAAREDAAAFLLELNAQLERRQWLFSDSPGFADMAILPFVRQFAHVDPDWFSDQPWHPLAEWLERFKTSARFASIMPKFAQWREGDAPVIYPQEKSPAKIGGA